MDRKRKSTSKVRAFLIIDDLAADCFFFTVKIGRFRPRYKYLSVWTGQEMSAPSSWDGGAGAGFLRDQVPGAWETTSTRADYPNDGASQQLRQTSFEQHRTSDDA